MKRAVILAGLIAVAALSRSQQAPPLTFEVASIHRSDQDAGAGQLGFMAGGRFRAINYPVRTILSRALRIDYSQIVNAPEWANSDRYVIEARAGDSNATEDQMRQMLVALFEDRFHMKSHRASPDAPVYVLAVDKKGPKLKESAETTQGPIQAGGGSIQGRHTTITLLATVLTRMLGRPVVDETRLDGKYDFQIHFDADSVHGQDFRARETDAAPGEPSIFTAMQEQIGLRLESTKRPVETVVIDSISRPAEN